jgi:hypothetical protein
MMMKEKKGKRGEKIETVNRVVWKKDTAAVKRPQNEMKEEENEGWGEGRKEKEVSNEQPDLVKLEDASHLIIQIFEIPYPNCIILQGHRLPFLLAGLFGTAGASSSLCGPEPTIALSRKNHAFPALPPSRSHRSRWRGLRHTVHTNHRLSTTRFAESR